MRLSPISTSIGSLPQAGVRCKRCSRSVSIQSNFILVALARHRRKGIFFPGRRPSFLPRLRSVSWRCLMLCSRPSWAPRLCLFQRHWHHFQCILCIPFRARARMAGVFTQFLIGPLRSLVFLTCSRCCALISVSSCCSGAFPAAFVAWWPTHRPSQFFPPQKCSSSEQCGSIGFVLWVFRSRLIYSLHALELLAKSMQGRDVAFWPALQAGVPTGVAGDIPLSNTFIRTFPPR